MSNVAIQYKTLYIYTCNASEMMGHIIVILLNDFFARIENRPSVRYFIRIKTNSFFRHAGDKI